MKRIAVWLFCLISLGSSGAPVRAQHNDPTQYSDPRTPQGTLRVFAAALTKPDLAKAASYIVDAKPAANLPEIAQAMQKRRTQYSMIEPRIAVNGDIATISFLLRDGQPPNLSSSYAWAVLRRNENAWYIDAAQTLAITNSVDPFSSFVSLLSGQRLPGEELENLNRDNVILQGRKFRNLGDAIQMLVADKDGKFALQNSQLRQSLLPYLPALDVLLRYPEGQNAQISFNTRLTNLPIDKVRDPQRTVMLYEGENGKLDFRHNGRAIVLFVDGHVRYMDAESAKTLLQWAP